MSAFFNFLKKFTDGNPQLTAVQAARIGGAAWASFTAEEKSIYEEEPVSEERFGDAVAGCSPCVKKNKNKNMKKKKKGCVKPKRKACKKRKK